MSVENTCLILLIGECFRSGSQHSRIRGNESSYSEQIEACNTHIKFIKHLKDVHKIKPEVSLYSYTTKYDDELKQFYRDHLIQSCFYDNVIGLNPLFHNSIENTDLSKYKFILYLRIDLFLKEEFFKVFDPSWTTIKFPTICWYKDALVAGKPRVNDVMLFVPSKYYGYLNNIEIGHDAWLVLSNNTPLTPDDLGVMINTYHDTDSEKDYNPLYYIVNRPRTDVWHSEGHIFSGKISAAPNSASGNNLSGEI